MKIRLRSTGLTPVAIGLLVLSALFGQAYASTTTTLLTTQTFASSTFPPTGWTDNSYSDYGGNYTGGYSGWYWSANGYNGSNGSMLCDFWDGCVGPLITPTVDASIYGVDGDTAFVDFDLFWEYNTYDQLYDVSYGVDDKLIVTAMDNNGSSQLLSLVNHSDYTYTENSYTIYYDPLTTAGAWKHYHVGIPKALRSSSLSIAFDGEYYSGWGLETAAIDNVTITGTHFLRISSAPAALSFGSSTVGTPTASQSIIISNPNPASFAVGTPTLGGTYPGDFQITHFPTVLGPGTAAAPFKDSVTVLFNPTNVGSRTATVTFTNTSDGPSPITVSLGGTGTAPAIAISTTTLFNRTHVRLKNSADQFMLVSSTGSGPLTISPSTNVTGDAAAEYSIVRLPAVPIPSGSSDTIWMRFSPAAEGARPAKLNIVSNGANGTQVVTFSGVGVLPRLTVTPSPLNFDSVGIGVTQCKTLILHNPGTDTVQLTHNFFSSFDADFTLTGVTGADTSLPPDQSRTVTVCFRPIRNGMRQARFRVTTNIPTTFDVPARDTSSINVNILGEGVPYGSLAIAGSSVVDSAIVGQRLCVTDTFYNTGTADIVITGAVINGSDSLDYTLSGVTFPITVLPGGRHVFDICATPSQRGDRNAILLVTGTTNGQTATGALPLDVYGQLVCASTTPDAAFSQKTCLGLTDTAVVTVSNCGDIASAYSVSIKNSTAQYRILGSATSPSVAAGGTTTFMVAFTPIVRNQVVDSLVVVGGPGVGRMAVALLGSAGASAIAGEGDAKNTAVGDSSTFDATINNTGECDWVPGVPTILSPAFGYVSGGTNVIPAGGSGSMTFVFRPTAVGTITTQPSFPNAVGVSSPAAIVTLLGIAEPNGVARVTEAGGFVLQQNYPNPFGSGAIRNQMTEIRFTLPKDGNVKLDIVDASGKIVRTVLDQRMTAGDHGTVVNATDLASGVYYYTLTSGSIKLTRQMMLVK